MCLVFDTHVCVFLYTFSYPDLFHGQAAAHPQRSCDSNCIPAISRACVLTCRSTVLAWSRSPATPGTKTGPVGETGCISLYSNKGCLHTSLIHSVHILYGLIKGGTTLAMQSADTFSPASYCINADLRTTGNLIVNTGNGLEKHCFMSLHDCTSVCCCCHLILLLNIALD